MKIAIVQIRGMCKVRKKVKDTLRMLNLPRKCSCAIVEVNPSLKGMLIAVQDFITWGEIDTDTLKLLLEKRGRMPGGKRLEESYLKEKTKKGFVEFAKALTDGKNSIKDVPGLKSFFRLNPPKGGFGNQGTKKPFSIGGALGYRGAKINDLLKRMI